MPKKRTSNRDGVYQRKDRPGFWVSWSDEQGRRRYKKTECQTLTEAKRLRASIMSKVERAKILGIKEAGNESFSEVADRYLEHQKVRLTLRSFERTKGIIERYLKPDFNCKIASIKKGDIQSYVTERSSKVSAGSVIKELNVLKHLFALAVEWEIIQLNPCTGIKSPKTPPGRVRYLQPAELNLIIDECPNWLKPIVALAVSTGMRRSEILNLRWVDVDINNNRIVLSQTKNNTTRVVYLNQSAQAVLLSLPVNEKTNLTDEIFQAVCPDYVGASFRKVCRNLGIENFRFHDLRHTCASWLRMSGADIHVVASILGHKDLRMAVRYQHLSPAFLNDAVNRLDGVLGISRYQDVTGPKELSSSSVLND